MASFSIYPRKRKKGKPVFYVQFKKPDGTYTIAKSTGQTTRRDAETWAENELLRSGAFLPGRQITLTDYSRNFFDWNSTWATDKRVRGLRISQRHCRERSDILRNHIIPAIGDRLLSEIDRAAIKSFRNNLFDKGYSGGLINHCLGAIKAILEAAEEQGIIKYIPRIDRAANNPKPRGILTPEEVRTLFSDAVQWWDERGRIGNLLAATTGLRLGELQALTLADLHLDAAGYIRVWRSYDRRGRKLNQTTKTGKERNLFIPLSVQEEIKKLILLNPQPNNPDSFLFFSWKIPGKPTEQLTFLKSLKKALQEIGISESERRQRNITFHSWRHWLNSLLINARIPLQKIQSITGHLSTEMSQHYYKLDDMSDVLSVQDSIFSTGDDPGDRITH